MFHQLRATHRLPPATGPFILLNFTQMKYQFLNFCGPLFFLAHEFVKNKTC